MDTYWIIDYRIRVLSDFHAGAGITLITGNTHGLRLDEDNQPYLPATQVRGLMRQAGYNLTTSMPDYKTIFKLNFPDGVKGNSNIKKQSAAVDNPRGWSFTRAQIKSPVSAKARSELWPRQAHIHIDAGTGVVLNLFGYEKAGAKRVDDQLVLRGRIYSNTPATEKDVAFLLTCMRFEDRIGHRRTRGYGKICCDWDRVRCFQQETAVEEKYPQTIFEQLFQEN